MLTTTNHADSAHRERILRAYVAAKDTIIERGFASEIDWQEGLIFSRLTEDEFLREAAWVVLSAGFRETIVRQRFPAISRAFLHFSSAAEITRCAHRCYTKAVQVLRHEKKLAAILAIAQRVKDAGFPRVKANIESDGVAYLRGLPYIGPVTCYHLAKNVGLDVVKPDRHLCRVARATRYPSPEELCQAISLATGDRVGVVDLVIWRFATIEPRYVGHFRGES